MVVSTFCLTTFAQTTANNFAYPQSIFVDSYNGHLWVTDFDHNRVLRFDVSTLTSMNDSQSPSILQNYFLGQNYPNPFNSETQIIFAAKTPGEVLLEVYNILGQKITTLFNEIVSANTTYSVSFDAENLPSGIYLYSLRTENGSDVKKMCLLK
jgi:hypothetical protein